jgi:sugar/nucleoside kinase (ribokinase family)
MLGKVLFAGDANLDLVFSGLEKIPQEDKEIFCEGFTLTLGGSCTLTAAAYAHIGGSCDFCGLLGNDPNGDNVMKYLADAGVGLRLLRRQSSVNTGVTVNLVRAATRTQVTYPGCLAIVDETEVILRDLSKYTHIHLSGIYGTIKFLPRIAEILLAARSAGVTTSMDTQWDSSEKWRFADEWLPLLTFLFVNEAEASSLAFQYGGQKKKEAGWKETWDCLRMLTVSPIIKLGPHGAYAGGKLYEPFRVEHVVDPTGAGDSFAAGFLYGIIEAGYDFNSAMWYAQAAGALACSFEGGYSTEFTQGKVAATAQQRLTKTGDN